MMHVVCLLLVGLSAWVHETSAQGSSTWSCDTLTPNLGSLRDRPASSPLTSPFQIRVGEAEAPHADQAEEITIQAGQTVPVTLIAKPPGEITGFIIQMRRPGSDVPEGTWSVISNQEHAEAIQCGSQEKDTAANGRLHALQAHELSWRAPDSVPDGYKVQVVGAAIDGSVGEYWNLHGNSVVWIHVTTAVVVPEVPEVPAGTNGTGSDGGDGNTGGEEVDPQVTSLDKEDEHDLLLETRLEQEYLQKKQADIAMENLASETDNTLEEEKKQHEQEMKWEMEDYEKRMYEEELKRQARIDAELRDKEEWEAKQYELEQKRLAEEEQRRKEREEMLGDTLQEIDMNEIDKELPGGKASNGVRHTSTFALYTCFIIIMAALL